MTTGHWTDDDSIPYEQWVKNLEAKYGKKIAKVIIDAPPPKRRKGFTARTAHGEPTRQIVGNPENPDAGPEAVDRRWHQARRERGA